MPNRLPLRAKRRPFIKSVRRNQAAPTCKRILKRRFLGQRFKLGIGDRSLRPGRFKPPLHLLARQPPILHHDHRSLLGRRDVITRLEIKFNRAKLPLYHPLLLLAQRVPIAHRQEGRRRPQIRKAPTPLKRKQLRHNFNKRSSRHGNRIRSVDFEHFTSFGFTERPISIYDPIVY